MSELLQVWPVGFVIASLIMTPLAPFLMALTLLPACSEPLEVQGPDLPSYFGASGSNLLTDALLALIRGASCIKDGRKQSKDWRPQSIATGSVCFLVASTGHSEHERSPYAKQFLRD